jgi:hypothetical protein
MSFFLGGGVLFYREDEGSHHCRKKFDAAGRVMNFVHNASCLHHTVKQREQNFGLIE